MGLSRGCSLPEAVLAPTNWQFTRLGELATFVTSGSRGWARFYTKAGALFIRSQNVRDGRLRLDDVQYVSPPAGAEGDRTKVKRHDLLITITGNSVGNVALVEEDFAEAYISQHVGLVRLKEPAAAPYICRYLSPFSPGNAQIFLSQSGQSKPGLNLQNIRDFLIASPPTARERDDIAETLTGVDALLDTLDRFIAKKRDLKQAAMQQLLTGQTRLPGFEGEWEVKRLAEVANIRSGGTPDTSKLHYWNGKIAWCTPTDITAMGGSKYLSATSRKITREGLVASSAEMIPSNSIVMTSRATIGECAINVVPITTNQGFKNFVPKANTDTEFLYYLLLTQKQGFISLCGGSTFLEIGKGQLAGYEVRLPVQKNEQTAIATVLSDIDAELEALKQRCAKTAVLKQGMMQELLTGRTRLV